MLLILSPKDSDNKIGLGINTPTEAVHISGSGATKLFVEGDISGSITSTGSFGRVEATTIGGNSPLTIESDNFNVRADGTISGSANSTASFGKAKFDRTVAIGDQALNDIGNYTLWVEDHDNGNGIYATDQSFIDNIKIYNDFFLNQESAYATIKVSANNRGLLLDASYGGGYTGDIFHRATGHRFFPKGSVTKGEELFVITGSHFTSASVMLSGSATSTGSFGRVEAHGGLHIPTVGSQANGILFGDGDTGFYETADDDVYFKRGGNTVFRANTSSQLDIGVQHLFYNTTSLQILRTQPI